MKFEKYPISEEVKQNLLQLGFKRPTDIQFKSIPSIMKGQDVQKSRSRRDITIRLRLRRRNNSRNAIMSLLIRRPIVASIPRGSRNSLTTLIIIPGCINKLCHIA